MCREQASYHLWREDPYFDTATRQELAAIAGDPREIEDRAEATGLRLGRARETGTP